MRPVRGGEADRYSPRRHHLHEWRRESLWLWPAVAAVGAWVAASLVVAYAPSPPWTGAASSRSNLDDARALLGTVATAILTFTGVVFSITLVALQMASSQYSPLGAAQLRAQAGDQAGAGHLHRHLRLLA